MDNASDYGSELLGSTLGWLTLCFFCVSVSPQQTAGKIAFQPVFVVIVVVIVVPLFVFFVFLQMFCSLIPNCHLKTEKHFYFFLFCINVRGTMMMTHA